MRRGASTCRFSKCCVVQVSTRRMVQASRSPSPECRAGVAQSSFGGQGTGPPAPVCRLRSGLGLVVRAAGGDDVLQPARHDAPAGCAR